MERTTRTASAPGRDEQLKPWMVCPVLSEAEIYRRPPRSDQFRLPLAFETKARAEQWLDELEYLGQDGDGNLVYGFRKNAASWLGPVLVRDLPSHSGPPLEKRFHLKKLLNADPGESQEIDHYTQMAQVVNQQHHRVHCCLGSDWDFNSIWEQVIQSRAHKPWGRKVEGFAHQILQVLFELESNLFERHPRLPISAVADFWLSWQVYFCIACFCSELAADPNFRRLAGTRKPETVCEEARYFVGTELVRYTREIKQSRATLASSGAVHQHRFVAKAWDQISIRFTDDHHVQVTIGDQSDVLSLASMGFEDRRGQAGKPVLAWILLCAFAQNSGSLKRPAEGTAKLRQFEKALQDLQKRLRVLFSIQDLPITYDKQTKTYKTLFKIHFPGSERL